ncbi:Pycsar system effector family protein [Neisseria subflava]|jgi:hypothetical protein|uniref:Pycsar system effector family protein n=1 Tax=Neisseria subflava TaxID=28449 RepID=UPI00202AA983|nr:Pycsar system effector family protein [Neisseria subflava]MCL9764014.1 hypothetical protein [Neisseria subflava]
MYKQQWRLSNDTDKLHLTLDRIIGFISNCDTKVSFWFSFFGAILTILSTLKTPTTEFIKSVFCANPRNRTDEVVLFIFMLIFLVSAICFIIGLYFLSKALMAKITNNEDRKSNIFFGHIASNRNQQAYLKCLKATNLNKYIEDLVSQIYINSKICEQKFKNYNKGVKISGISIIFLLVSWLYIFQK